MSKLNHFDRFGQTTSTILHHYANWAKTQNINYNILAVIHTLSRYQTCTQKQICVLWELPKQTVSTTCSRLLLDGVIEFLPADRLPDASDKREKRIQMTEQGRIFATPIIDRLDAIEQSAIDEFGEQRALALIDELGQFGGVLARAMKQTKQE